MYASIYLMCRSSRQKIDKKAHAKSCMTHGYWWRDARLTRRCAIAGAFVGRLRRRREACD